MLLKYSGVHNSYLDFPILLGEVFLVKNIKLFVKRLLCIRKVDAGPAIWWMDAFHLHNIDSIVNTSFVDIQVKQVLHLEEYKSVVFFHLDLMSFSIEYNLDVYIKWELGMVGCWF